MTSPTHLTNWIIASDELVHKGDTVRLDDGREGVIVRVSDDRRGWPVVDVDGQPTVVHPAHIAGRVR